MMQGKPAKNKKPARQRVILSKPASTLPAPFLRLPAPVLQLTAPLRRLVAWPLLPWLILVALIVALLLLLAGCRVLSKCLSISPAATFSRTVPGYYGEFKLLANSQPVDSILLTAIKLTDGRALIVYRSSAGIIPVMFDPQTSSFHQLHDPISINGSGVQQGASSWLLLNDHTLVMAGGTAYRSADNSINGIDGGAVIDLLAGTITPFGAEKSFGYYPLLLRLSDGEFVIGEPQAASQYSSEASSDQAAPPDHLRVYSLQGQEVRSSEVTPQLITSYSLGGATSSADFTYDTGDKILIFLSQRLDVLDKSSLTLTPITNSRIYGDKIEVLPNGLILIHNHATINTSNLSGFLVNPINYQSVPLELTTGLPIRQLAWQGISEFTEESIADALKLSTRMPYRLSALLDGTLLAVPNNLQDINKHPYLIDLNNYRLIENAAPSAEAIDLRNSSILNPQSAVFDADITLNDGRVLYLGLQNVIYTPASQRTPEQEAIQGQRKELPDWPSTDFRSQGVWQLAGNLKDTIGVDPTSAYNLNTFIQGIAAVGGDLLVKWIDDKAKIYGQLFHPATKQINFVDNTKSNQSKYDELLAEQLDRRYIVHTSAGTFRVAKPVTGSPTLTPPSILLGQRLSQIPQRMIERYDAKTKQWIDVNEEIYQELVKRYERQGRARDVSSWDSDAISALEKKVIEDAQKKAADKPKNPKAIVIDKAKIGGRLLKARAGHSVTTLPDGRIVVAGGMADLSDLPAVEPFDDKGRILSNYILGTITLPGTQITLGNITGTKFGLSRSVEIYNPKTRQSKEIGKLKIGRSGHQAVVLPNNKLLIVGGSEQEIGAKNASRSEKTGQDTFTPGSANSGPTYEIFDLCTGQSELHENVLMFRRDKAFWAFAMPNGYVYLGDTGLYSNAEVLDWQNGISYPTGQPALRGLGEYSNTVRLSDGRLISTGGEADTIRDATNRVTTVILSPTSIEAYTPATKGPRVLPLAAANILKGWNWDWRPALRYFLYLQLTILLLGMPLIYALAYRRRRA